MTERPKSAAGLLTGLVGLSGGLSALFLLQSWEEAIHVKALAVLGMAALPMVLVEFFLYQVHTNPASGLADKPVNAFNPLRIAQKLLAFWGTIGVIAAFYWLLPEYGGSFYDPFKQAFLLCLPALVAISPFYIAFVDRRQVEPEDAYVKLTALLAGRKPDDWSVLASYLRGWLVKAFFLPLMFVFVIGDLKNFWAEPIVVTFTDFRGFYDLAYDFLYFCDVLIATIGYVFTLRLFDAHIRSGEPTLFGWLVCLCCYPPFWPSVTSKYLAYDQDNAYWGSFFWDLPPLYVAWGSIILVLIAIYAYATFAFGLRFSNLTHRGIITSGPYRWLKHPAYVAKNLTWWMISVPFLTTAGWAVALQSSLLLVGVNLVYYLRAITEERHLARDPVYRQYQDFIAEHGLWAKLLRLLRLNPSTPDKAPQTPPP